MRKEGIDKEGSADKCNRNAMWGESGDTRGMTVGSHAPAAAARSVAFPANADHSVRLLTVLTTSTHDA